MTGSYDPELNLVYWGTGNPGPDYDGTVREGDNLYSDSVVALDADTGELRWYFQFTPHDIHDWDSTQIPVLADTVFGGEQRKLMLFPNRNAFFYVLDRETGEFLLGKPYARQTWAEGLDETGRPILLPGKEPTAGGNRRLPRDHGRLQLVVAHLQPPHGAHLRHGLRRRDPLLHPPDRVSGGPELPGRRRRVAAASRQLRPRRAGALAPDRRPALGVPGRPAHHVRA